MGLSKETKNKIMNLIYEKVPTDEIAKRLNYSVGTIRKGLEELREEHGVNTTWEIAEAYRDAMLLKELLKLNACLNSVIKTIKSRNIATIEKADKTGKSTKNKKKKK